MAERELRRQYALSLPMVAAETAEAGKNDFEILETISQKFSALSDEELDMLFGEVLADIRDTEE